MYGDYAGPPSSPMSLICSVDQNGTGIRLQWNSSASDVLNIKYIISITPLLNMSSIFTTLNDSIYLPLLAEQEYNVSVVASNCAGNSTPIEIGMSS